MFSGPLHIIKQCRGTACEDWDTIEPSPILPLGQRCGPPNGAAQRRRLAVRRLQSTRESLPPPLLQNRA